MFIPSEIEAGIQMVEATMPDTPGGRLMRAAYRPFMLQIAKELDQLPTPLLTINIYDGVAKLTANLIVTTVRSTADPDRPNAEHALLATLIDMLSDELGNNMAQPIDHENAVLLKSTEGGMQ